MTDRLVNGQEIYLEGWDSLCRDVFHWLLEVGADGLGMQVEAPAAVAEALDHPDLPVTRRAVERRLDILLAGEKPPLLRFERNGKRFLMFRRWQDRQKIRYPVRPVCPFPPPEVFARLSEKTQRLLLSNYKVTTEKTAQGARPSVSGPVSIPAREGGEEETARARPGTDLGSAPPLGDINPPGPGPETGEGEEGHENLAAMLREAQESLEMASDGEGEARPSNSAKRGQRARAPVWDEAQERLWGEVWELLSTIPGWPAEEEKSRATAVQVFATLRELDHVREATKMKLWLLKSPHKKPSLRRWVNWLQIAEEKRLGEQLRRQDYEEMSAAARPGAGWPEAESLTERQALELLHSARRDGRLIPKDLQEAYCARAGVKHSWEIEKKLEKVSGL